MYVALILEASLGCWVGSFIVVFLSLRTFLLNYVSHLRRRENLCSLLLILFWESVVRSVPWKVSELIVDYTASTEQISLYVNSWGGVEISFYIFIAGIKNLGCCHLRVVQWSHVGAAEELEGSRQVEELHCYSGGGRRHNSHLPFAPLGHHRCAQPWNSQVSWNLLSWWHFGQRGMT